MDPVTAENPGSDISKAAVAMLAAATQLGLALAQQRREALALAAQQSEHAARNLGKLQQAELRAAQPVIRAAQMPQLWNQSLPEIATTYRACKTWEDIDQGAARGAKSIEVGLDQYYPGWRENTSAAQEAANPHSVTWEAAMRLADLAGPVTGPRPGATSHADETLEEATRNYYAETEAHDANESLTY